MYHVIHQSTWDYYCLFGVDGELPNSFKKTDLSNLWKYHIPSCFFFLSSRPMTLVSFLFLPCSELCPPCVCKRGSRGGDRGSGPPPPLRFVRGGVLCRGLMGRRGGPTVVCTLSLSIFFRLAPLASIMQTYYMYTYLQVQVGMERSSFLCIPLFKLWKESTFSSFAFMKGDFHILSFLELHDFLPWKSKIFWGRTPRPPSQTHKQYKKYRVICVFM